METETVRSRNSFSSHALLSAVIAELEHLKKPIQAPAIISRFSDFWLLGGASIVLWVVMAIGYLFRGSSEAIESHFLQAGAFFSMMSIFCNHPHFMISYRFGYGRGKQFVFKHWFSLLVIPVGLIAFYILAYFNFEFQLSGTAWVSSVNSIFEKTGLAFRLGTLNNLGTEILSLSVIFMNLTVGWHYSKQAFGSIMVYGKYDQYPFSILQRRIIKASLFSLSFLNFFYRAFYLVAYGSSQTAEKSYFYNIPLISLGLPKILYPITAVIVAVLSMATIVFVFYSNYRRHGKLPSANLLVPWLSFHFWCVPLFWLPEYYMGAVPFFHSLQYLPFAYRLEEPQFRESKWPEMRKSIFLAILLFVGFCGFELVPGLLDRVLETTWYLKTWFFMIAFSVFINIHHFFIDSVVWKFNQPDIRERLLPRASNF